MTPFSEVIAFALDDIGIVVDEVMEATDGVYFAFYEPADNGGDVFHAGEIRRRLVNRYGKNLTNCPIEFHAVAHLAAEAPDWPVRHYMLVWNPVIQQIEDEKDQQF